MPTSPSPVPDKRVTDASRTANATVVKPGKPVTATAVGPAPFANSLRLSTSAYLAPRCAALCYLILHREVAGRPDVASIIRTSGAQTRHRRCFRLPLHRLLVPCLERLGKDIVSGMPFSTAMIARRLLL